MTTPSISGKPSLPRWLAGLACLMVLAGVGRHYLYLALERDAFVTPLNGPLTPDALGVPSRQSVFSSGDRLLHGSYVQAASPDAPALAVFHGDEESLSDWAPVQALLWHAGISSFVFDYSGYGASSGHPSVRNLHEDALAAYRQFIAATPTVARRYAMGFSLGSGVLLDVVGMLRPAPAGVVIGAGFASARTAAVQTGKVPRWIAWLLPEPWDNEARVRSLDMPLLLVHSRRDEVIPFDHGERLERAAVGPHSMVVLDGMPHDAAIEAEYMEAFWAPVIGYLQTDRLP